MISRVLLALLLIAGPFGPALAQDEGESDAPYADDRSTPEAVITSFCNAINRAEYARAYSYYGQSAAPANYDHWQAGYSDTSFVEVSFGETSQEGAAGSIYYSVPVKLAIETPEGRHRYFEGCYTIRLANPAIQGVPFEPMHIEGATLRPSTSRAGPPASCN